ncbi:uncharacterized protein VP01_1117g5 [Puccinia sorghi]|uniref:Uncharacterized protein n=1 Tax=Puccinia sorghi TaxID=27349 RepID=A0A0L6VTX2_9BASI|nr:uncharacterized protein VP01_1117g5 [Puccinia sorghi]
MTILAKGLTHLMLENVWKLPVHPKLLPGHQLGIRLNPSTEFHPQTDGQSKIANKAIEQYLPHFISYHQDDWVTAANC